MSSWIKNIISKRTKKDFGNDLPAGSEDAVLFKAVGEYMRSRLDIEEVQNDPDLSIVRNNVSYMISDYKTNISGNKENEKFIGDILSGEKSQKALKDEIKSIIQEISDNKLDGITSEWVKEWHEQKQKAGGRDKKTAEIREFITGAINSSESEHADDLNEDRLKRQKRNLFVRYASLAAAALVGVLILIRTILPSPDTEKLFNSYYRPFDAISPVTRSLNNNESVNYSSAIESYKTGNYQMAASGFTGILQKDPSLISPRFFLGLSQLELRDYQKAVDLLEGVVNESGEYGKESRWYLGLSYLKTGNKQKAAECFEVLSRSDGFYRERSEKILRRLK
jgi:TolA-binding protein